MFKFFAGRLLAGYLLLAAAGNIHADAITVHEGTEVKLALQEPLSSATAVAGQRFNLLLEEDLRVDGVLVVPRGTLAVGSVVFAEKRGFMGKGGELNIKVDYLVLGDQRLPLRASAGQSGQSKVGASVALAVLFGPVGLLKRGKDVVVEAGTIFSAYTDQPLKLVAAPTAVADGPRGQPASPDAAAPTRAAGESE